MPSSTHAPAPVPRRTREQVIADQLEVIGRAVTHRHPRRPAPLHRRHLAPGLRYSAFSGAVSLLTAAGRTPQ
ncbi:hypothetical protein ACIG3E_32475 [Streptomyces sp. NPDC053474]|uniref:hypothetical protein n=1 Tax=Streptomyces sp. NPDC053474 TaxID=3365704 RepID=UPI0037CD6C41